MYQLMWIHLFYDFLGENYYYDFAKVISCFIFISKNIYKKKKKKKKITCTAVSLVWFLLRCNQWRHCVRGSLHARMPRNKWWRKTLAHQSHAKRFQIKPRIQQQFVPNHVPNKCLQLRFLFLGPIFFSTQLDI